ncbi:MAG: hypothetical protein ACRC30_15280 [Clostridium sp.]
MKKIIELKNGDCYTFKVKSVCTKKFGAMNLKVHTNNSNNKQIFNYIIRYYIKKYVYKEFLKRKKEDH